MKNPTNRLFVMTRYRDAYKKGRATRRWKHGNSQKCKDGWIPNTFWVSSDTAGLNGGARRREIESKYREFFEIIDCNEFKKRYPSTRYTSNSNYDYGRIRSEKREEWNLIVEAEEKKIYIKKELF